MSRTFLLLLINVLFLIIVDMLQNIVSVLVDILLNTMGSDVILLACSGAFTCLVLCGCGMLLEHYSTRG